MTDSPEANASLDLIQEVHRVKTKLFNYFLAGVGSPTVYEAVPVTAKQDDIPLQEVKSADRR